MEKYIIKDWANNVCYQGQEFSSFEEAWAFLREQFPNDYDNELDEFEVVKSC